MEMLAKQIEERMHGVWRHCLIYEKDLERIWPINEKDRKEKIVQFAKKYGFHLRFYGKGMGAIFDKWPQQQVASKAAKADGSNNIDGSTAFYEETKDKPLGLSSHHGCSLEQ